MVAMYHQTADRLKNQVADQAFTSEQLTTILKMMRGCTMLRQGKVINSFFECMIPEGFELKEGKERTGQYGKSYRLSYVVKIGDSIPEEIEGEEN